MLDAVEYIHDRELYHLDIKLENVLLGEDFMLKLIDFDASYHKTKDFEIKSKGTENYRAPEIISSKCKDPAAADVYSLGILLFLVKT